MLNRNLLVLSLLSLNCVFTAPVFANISNIQVSSENSLSLKNQAQRLYENGEFQPAITILKDDINNYQKQDNFIGQIITWRNLALVYQKMGNPQEAKQAVSESIKYLPKITDDKKRQELFAKTLEVQGQIQLSIGEIQKSLDTWKQVIDIYEKSGDSNALIRTKINEAQSLQGLGLYNQAVKSLTTTQLILDKQPDTLLKAKALLTLGDVLRGVRKLDDSLNVLNQSLTIAEKLSSNSTITEVLISLGKTHRLKLNSEQAINYYQQAIEKSPTSDLLIQGYLNQIELLLSDQKIAEIQVLIPKIQDTLTKLPASRSGVYARITFAKTILNNEKIAKSYQNLIVNELAIALKLAKSLADNRAESYTLGVLGNVYEKNQRYAEAQKLTEKAVLIAQRIKAPDINYKWQWQLGRILAAQGNKKDAISAYKQTVETLKNIRTDLVAISSDLQFSFREDVEPVYRELAGLLLKEKPSQEELKDARKVIEDLQLAELDNYFRNACLNSKSVEIDELNDPTTAVFYTLILKDRLELIVALPNKPLQHYSQSISEENVEKSVKGLKRELTNIHTGSRKERLRLSQQIYSWLINKELATKLETSKISNLVFIADGVLRNIPLAALYDGKQYLIEKYSVALAPSLQLVDIKPLPREQVQLLAGGVSETRSNFVALPNVLVELEQIKAKFPTGIFLKNESFTNFNVENKIKQYPAQIVHLATHGQFSSNVEETFILTWDNVLNIDQLKNLLSSDTKQIRPIELLVLSACQTANGDEKAALGLAGIAVKAGARSTIASLWSVDDEATSLLMNQLYQELANSKLTKAEALRRAQLAVLNNNKFQHPYYWSAFVLIGNWL
ncbi:CHAT domain-containing protein [Anabaena sp. UHCC 0204]|uniref:CHAT domain-containing protein n=1 Tax=Anabaena sp. UHCC 0204 TaxID=2590009 RepID=UPI001446F109|nr:CHAT domain-containing protein [Anabaena sp. UHCC 0204]MTJ10175.1 CHAT domain-containing protein [Anabaena sp. UHCC 0204]